MTLQKPCDWEVQLVATETEIADTCERLKRSMRVTTGARFNASKRLHSHDEHLNVSVAIVTVYVIGLTVFQATFQIEHNVDHIITLTNILLSILVLVFALLQYASSDAIHAEQHHKCALEIDELRRQLDVSLLRPTIDELARITEAYGEVLKSSNLNHEDRDMWLYVCDRPELNFKVDCVSRLWIKLSAWLSGKFPYIIVTIAGVGVAALALYASGHIEQSHDKQPMKTIVPTNGTH